MNTGLTTMRLPQLTHLGEGALSGCDQLTEIEIPGSLKKVDQFAFSESEYLEKVVIQSGVTEISRCAFAFCYRLQTLEWQSPATVKKIGCGIQMYRLHIGDPSGQPYHDWRRCVQCVQQLAEGGLRSRVATYYRGSARCGIYFRWLAG